MTEPAGVSVDVTTEDARVLRALRDLAWKVEHLDEVLDDMGSAMRASTQQRFLDARAPDDSPWPKLAAITLARHPSGDSAKPLRRSNLLYTRLTYRVAPNEGVRVGSTMTYARIHQFGGQAGRGRKVTIPARPYLGLSEADKDELLAIVNDHLAEATR